MTEILSDAAARESISTRIHESHFVEAGAGSGKTHQLVARIITAVVDEGVPISRIAAITFTVAAAEELRTRVARRLGEIIDTGQIAEPGGKIRRFSHPEQARARAEAAMASLPGAAIETLHAFSGRIIRLYPLETGVPPEIEIASPYTEGEHAEAVAATVEEVLSWILGDSVPGAVLGEIGLREDELGELLAPLAAMDIKRHVLDKLATWMDENWNELGATLQAPLPEPIDLDEAFLRTEILVPLQDILIDCTNHEDSLAVKINSAYSTIVEGITLAEDPADIDAPDLDIDLKIGNIGSKQNWSRPTKEVRDEFKSILKRIDARSARRYERHASAVIKLFAVATMVRARARIVSGRLQYQDLIYLVENLVTAREDSEDIRQMLRERFRLVMVDEFQDTDPAQFRILTALFGADGAAFPGATLFTVGDPKQSIYRFRRADIDSYIAARHSRAPEQLQKLSTNFRSTVPVIDWINTVFERLFAQVDASDSDDVGRRTPLRVPFEALAHSPSAATEDSGVVVIRSSDHGQSSSEAKAAEDRALVTAVHAAVGGRWKHEGESIRLSDIAILVRTHARAREIMEVFAKSGIPYVSEGSTLAFQAPEVEALVSVLRAAADPADQFAVASALRTPLMGCSDELLAKARLEDIRLSPISAPEARLEVPTERVSACLHKLWSYHGLASSVSAGELVDHILGDLAVAEIIASTQAYPASALRRMEFVRLQAHSYSADTGGDLRALVRFFDTQALESSRVSDPIIHADGADAVRIMTVHAAKGREFPVVMLGGMCGTRPSQQSPFGIHPDSGVITAELSAGLATPAFAEFSAYDKAADEAEDIRLLYVAATRAQTALVVPLETRNKKAGGAYGNSLGAPLAELGLPVSTLDEFREGLPDELPQLADMPTYSDALTATQLAEELDSIERIRREAEKANATPALQSVTAIAHSGTSADRSATWPRGGDEDALGVAAERVAADNDGINGISGAAFGTAAHAIMERIGGVDDIAAEAPAQAALAELPEPTVPRLSDVTRAFASSEPFRRAISSEHFRELPVFSTVGNEAVEGVVDLLYRDHGAWAIADYKTDVAATAETIEAYFTQLALYADLLDGALDLAVERIELVFARDGEPRILTRRRG